MTYITNFLKDIGNQNLFIAIGVLFIIQFFFRCIKGKTAFDLICGYLFVGYVGSICFYNIAKTNYNEIAPEDINCAPLVYCITMLILLALPFVNFKGNFRGINDYGIEKYLKIISIITFIFSILPFIEGTYRMFSITSADLVAAYEGTSENYSYLTMLSKHALSYFNFFIIPLTFYFLYKGSAYKCYLAFSLFAFLTNLILCYVGGGRGSLVNFVNYIVFIYFVFKNMISKQKLRVLKKYFAIIFPIIVLSLSAITIARFGGPTDKKNAMATSISLYIGQGPCEFSRGMWNSDVRTNGDNSFSLLKIFTGQKSFKENNDRRAYWEKYQDIPNFIFYTLIGDIYSDLGVSNTFYFCLSIATIFFVYIRIISKRQNISMQSIIILSLYFEWISMGCMNNCFKTYYSQFFVFITMLILLYLDLVQRKYKDSI